MTPSELSIVPYNSDTHIICGRPGDTGGRVIITDLALASHNHDSLYAALAHNHDSLYAALAHNHDSLYAALAHDHSGVYALVSHNHDGVYALVSHNHDSLYAALSHHHDDRYNSSVFCDVDVFIAHRDSSSPHSGVLSPINHNHDSLYAALAHNHDTAYAALSHHHDQLGDYEENILGSYYQYATIQTDGPVNGGKIQIRNKDVITGTNWQLVLQTGNGSTTETPLYVRHSAHAGGNYTLVCPNASGQRPIAYQWDTFASTRKLKKDIVPIDDPIVKIKMLHGIKFNHDSPGEDIDGKPDIGITFEDLESLELPSLTSRDVNGNPEGINLTKLIPVLVESIKSLTTRIEFLENQLT